MAKNIKLTPKHDCNISKLVGILNITTDSFSDGGLYNSLEAAKMHIEQFLKDGVDVIDVGAESTRPSATPIEYIEEWARLEPILALLQSELKDTKILLSVDTYHPETAKLALQYDVDWINDVSGCSSNAMQKLIANSGKTIVISHNLGVPVNKTHTISEDLDIVSVVKDWANSTLIDLGKQGICKEQIIFDPGIGFGKTSQQSLKLIKNISEFHELGLKIMVGHSRKSFFNLFTDVITSKRDIETCIASAYLSLQRVDYLRVHNVAENKRALCIAESLFS